MKKAISDLIKVADSLDKKGQYKLANDVDAIIKKYSKENGSPLDKFKDLGEVQLEIPEEEYKNIKEVAQALKDSISEEEGEE